MQKKELAAVQEFQQLFDVALAKRGTPRTDIAPEAVALNKRICVEELKETDIKGIEADNLVEIADGAGDSIYVIAHAVNQLGRTPDAGRALAARALLSDAIQRVNIALDEGGCPEDMIDVNLSFAEIVVRGIAATYGVPLDEVFAEIHRSNMTKVWEDGKGRKDAGGKVIKPPGYEKPDIAGVLKKYGAGGE